MGVTGELPDAILDPQLAALWAGVPAATLRQWANRPHTGIRRHQGGYRVSELDAWLARRKAKMIRRRAAA